MAFSPLVTLVFAITSTAVASEPTPVPSPPDSAMEFRIDQSSEMEVDGQTYILMDVIRESRFSKADRVNRAHSFDCSGSLIYDTRPMQRSGMEALSVVASAGVLASSALVLRTDLPMDKKRHYLAGVVIGAGATGAAKLLLRKSTPNYALKAALIGVGTSILIGLGKEVYDSRSGKGTPDKRDAFFTMAGGFHGTLAIDLVDLKSLFGR